ncbi:MAG: sensor histidine kinase [Chitinophagaceae bacterium]
MQKDKTDLIISVLSASLFVLMLAISIIIFFRIYLKRKNNLLIEKERMRIQFDQTILQSKLEIQEETFTYISRELHDNIGQSLSMAKLNLHSLDLPADDPKVEVIDDILERSIAELRSLSHSLDADRIRINGWTNEVERLLLILQKTGKFKINFTAEEELPELGKEKPIILFRIIQEIMNNIIKHARAHEIFFSALQKNNGINIEIKDDGVGFDMNKTMYGSGLNNLRSRAKMINAAIQIDSHPGKGTQILISINDEAHEKN